MKAKNTHLQIVRSERMIAGRTDDNFFCERITWSGRQFFSNGWPDPCTRLAIFFKRITWCMSKRQIIRNVFAWEVTNNPSSWTDLTFGDLYMYLINMPGIYTKESLKAFKSLEVYQFVISGHIKPLLCHSIGDNIPYCFIKGKVIPSQRINDQPHNVWVCLHKKEGLCPRSTLHMYSIVQK